MKLRTSTSRWLSFGAALAASAAVSGAALAAGTSVSLKAKGEYARLHRTACGKTKAFRAFRRSSTIEFRGFVTPAPAGHFPVRVKVERCVGRHWRRAGGYVITGKRLTGKFKGYFRAAPLAPRSRHHRRATSYYRVKAFVTGAESPAAYLLVTS